MGKAIKLNDHNETLEAAITVLSDIKKDSLVIRRQELFTLLGFIDYEVIRYAAKNCDLEYDLMRYGYDNLSNQRLYELLRAIIKQPQLKSISKNL